MYRFVLEGAQFKSRQERNIFSMVDFRIVKFEVYFNGKSMLDTTG
jgi:hypothetical protein